MPNHISAWPLAWPTGWPRTLPAYRRVAKFAKKVEHRWPDGKVANWKKSVDLTLNEARIRVLVELERMGLSREDVVISTNVPLRLDGEPRSGAREPDDPGVAVYWQEAGGARRCIAIDIYETVADNLAAIAATLDAMRAIERHGGAAILERAFTGFTALPAPGARREWWEVLGVPKGSSRDDITSAYRRLRSQHHPDKGGSAAAFDEVERAYREATS